MANVTYTVPNKNGSYDGDMVVKQYNSMIIDTGDTVTVDQPNRGLFILVLLFSNFFLFFLLAMYSCSSS